MSNEPKPPPQPSARPQEQLFEARTVMIYGEVDVDLAERTCARLLALANDSGAPILAVVSSPGGHVESGDAIHDIVRFIKPKVYMLGTGWVASAGALIYTSVPRDCRFALPNTRFMLHQPLGSVTGRAADVEIEAEQILAMRRRLNELFAAATGHDLPKIERDTDRNHWMSATQARDYGLVGAIISDAAQIPIRDAKPK